ncbi:hypothetical protein LWI28_021823 [Acer negundo]|uniref:AP2/ERF domain-containing protein n=1 Tax=Acer negundo TaxID=4023 RepID=A0AAD5JJY2_ACENE|nr:hypothetical protein LWI28_021823 [Acer negundo]
MLRLFGLKFLTPRRRVCLVTEPGKFPMIPIGCFLRLQLSIDGLLRKFLSSSSPSSSSSSTLSSSLSSCALSDVTTHQPEIPNTKRLRKTQNRDKFKNKNGIVSIPNSNPSAKRSSKYRGFTRIFKFTSFSFQNRNIFVAYTLSIDGLLRKFLSSSSPSSSSSTLSSSSSSCALSDVTTHQPEIPNTKRLRKSQNRDKCKNKNGIVSIPNSNPSAKRSSKYRGVTRHRWTGRFEAHLWDKTSWNNIQRFHRQFLDKEVILGANHGL